MCACCLRRVGCCWWAHWPWSRLNGPRCARSCRGPAALGPLFGHAARKTLDRLPAGAARLPLATGRAPGPLPAGPSDARTRRADPKVRPPPLFLRGAPPDGSSSAAEKKRSADVDEIAAGAATWRFGAARSRGREPPVEHDGNSGWAVRPRRPGAAFLKAWISAPLCFTFASSGGWPAYVVVSISDRTWQHPHITGRGDSPSNPSPPPCQSRRPRPETR